MPQTETIPARVAAMSPEQLDREVAERVMGWTLEVLPSLSGVAWQEMWRVGASPSGAGSCLISTDWSPTTNANHCEEVMEKMVGSLVMRRWSVGDWRVQLRKDHVNMGRTNESRLRAVCEVALIVILEQEQNDVK